MMEVTFLLCVTNKFAEADISGKIIQNYKKIKPTLYVVYNGSDPNFPHDVYTSNPGHSIGHYPQIKKGFEKARNISSRRVCVLCADDFLLNEDKIIEIYERMDKEKSCYSGSLWFDNGALSTEIFFVDLKWGDPIIDWEHNASEGLIEETFRKHVDKNGFKWTLIPERTPNHRFMCAELHWTMEHDINKSIEHARSWGYEI